MSITDLMYFVLNNSCLEVRFEHITADVVVCTVRSKEIAKSFGFNRDCVNIAPGYCIAQIRNTIKEVLNEQQCKERQDTAE